MNGAPEGRRGGEREQLPRAAMADASHVREVGAGTVRGARDPDDCKLPDGQAAGAALEGASPERVLRWAMSAFAPAKLALVSAFGPGSVVLIHLLAATSARLPVIFIDTLHHF